VRIAAGAEAASICATDPCNTCCGNFADMPKCSRSNDEVRHTLAQGMRLPENERRIQFRRIKESSPMRTPASIFHHPIHPMLIVFPIGLWIFSLACDLVDLAGVPGAWSVVAFYSMIGGLIGALCAAVPGFIDLFLYKGGAPPVKKVALTHMTINLIVVVLYAINIGLRAGTISTAPTGFSVAILLSIIGVAMLFVSGWLGGQMVHVYGVGVEGRD
jgi:uncharacterized membrane protein